MIIGVTGGIGSGKSTILRVIARRGYPVYDCDAQAKRIIIEDPDVHRQMIALFGEEVYHEGRYNTRLVSQQVFADHDKLTKLNAIVHPAVRQHILQWAKDIPLAFIETAILFQAGMDDLCDGIAVVTVPVEERIMRAMHRDKHASREDIERRIRAQHPPEDYLSTCHKPSILLLNDDDTPHSYLADQLIQFAQNL